MDRRLRHRPEPDPIDLPRAERCQQKRKWLVAAVNHPPPAITRNVSMPTTHRVCFMQLRCAGQPTAQQPRPVACSALDDSRKGTGGCMGCAVVTEERVPLDLVQQHACGLLAGVAGGDLLILAPQQLRATDAALHAQVPAGRGFRHQQNAIPRGSLKLTLKYASDPLRVGCHRAQHCGHAQTLAATV